MQRLRNCHEYKANAWNAGIHTTPSPNIKIGGIIKLSPTKKAVFKHNEPPPEIRIRVVLRTI